MFQPELIASAQAQGGSAQVSALEDLAIIAPLISAWFGKPAGPYALKMRQMMTVIRRRRAKAWLGSH